MKLNVLFATAVTASLFSINSEAKKYLIRFSSPQTFNELSQDLKILRAQSHLAKRDIFGRAELQGVKLSSGQALFTQSLDNIGMGFVEVSNPADLEILRHTQGIAGVEEDFLIPLPRAPLPRPSGIAQTTMNEKSDNEAPWGISTVEAQGAWQQGASGQGIKVAVLDTGIDKDHPDLKSRFVLGKDFVSSSFGGEDDGFSHGPASIGVSFARLLGVHDVVNRVVKSDDNDENEEAESESPAPYPYFDQVGHGTHVAGTIAGELNGKGVVGVAPQAQIMMGRVCGKFGCSNFSILNGINWAVENKARVISMSLGGPQDVSSQREALTRADNMGVVAVAAAGNDGTNRMSFPGGYDSVIGVGAIDSTGKRAAFSQYGPELDVVAPGVDVVSSVPMGTGRDSQVAVTLNGQTLQAKSSGFSGAPEVPNALSNSLIPSGLGKPGDFTAAVKGKFALIQRGEIPFSDKVKSAIAAGAAGVVIYNNTAGLISGAITQDGSIVAIPVVMIEQQIGEALVASINSGRTESATLKTLRTDYAAFQGTSMATPHVSGVVALILSKNPKLTPAQVKQFLYSSATPGPTTSENEYGHGSVNANAAVRAVGQGGF